jgi:hypothetical protein
MTAPHPSRFSFAAFAMLLFALGATSTARAQTTSAPTQTPAPTQSPPPPQKKVWTNDNVGGSHSQQNDASAPAQQNSNSTSTAPAKPKSKKDAKWYHDQIAKLQAQIPLLDKTRLPNCRPRSMARRSTSRSTTAGIESATGKNNCSNFRRSARTRSTKSLPSRMKLGTTAFRPTRSLNPVVCMSKKKAPRLCRPQGFFEPLVHHSIRSTGSSRLQPALFSGSSAAGFALETSASPHLSPARSFPAMLHNVCSALRGC